MPLEVNVRAPVPVRRERLPRPDRAGAPPDVRGLLMLAMAAGVLGTALVAGVVAAVSSASEGAERAGFVAVAAVSCLSTWGMLRTAGAVGPDAARLGLGVLLGVAAGLLVGRVADAPAVLVVLALIVGAAAGPAALTRLPSRARGPAAAGIALGAVMAFWPPEASVTPGRALAGAIAAGAVGWLLARELPAPPAAAAGRSRMPLRGALDAVAATGLLLVIGDSLFVPDESISDHMGFYLGPVNDVLHGRPMLVDTWSQYGNGVIYALVPWFSVAPIGYGTFSILTSAATGLQYVIVYAILRLTLRSQAVAIVATGLAVAVILFAGLGEYANYPSIGVLRFGPPYVVLLLGLLAVRFARRRRALVASAAVVVAVCVPWSAETAATAVAVAGAMLAVEALAVHEGRVRRLSLRLAALAALCVGAFALFCLITRLAAGAWPDWGPYAEFLMLYTTRGFGTLPISDWSPGLAVGAIYAASAVMVAGLVLRRPDAVRRYPESTLACAALAAMGAVSFTYFLGRSHPNNVVHVCLPAFMLVALWADGRGVGLVAGRARGARWAAALLAALAAVAFTASIPSLRDKWPRTVFAALMPWGGAGETQQSLSLRVQELWSNPSVDPFAPTAEAFVRRFAAGRPPILVLRHGLFAETLQRLRRSDAMPIANPLQDSLSTATQPRLRRAVAELAPGTREFVITDEAGNPVEEELVPLQITELELLDARFERRLLARDAETGLTAYALRPLG